MSSAPPRPWPPFTTPPVMRPPSTASVPGLARGHADRAQRLPARHAQRCRRVLAGLLGGQRSSTAPCSPSRPSPPLGSTRHRLPSAAPPPGSVRCSSPMAVGASTSPAAPWAGMSPRRLEPGRRHELGRSWRLAAAEGPASKAARRGAAWLAARQQRRWHLARATPSPACSSAPRCSTIACTEPSSPPGPSPA